MSDIILRVDNISKQYRLGLVGTGTLAHDLNRFWHKIRGKEDPYLRLGSVNNRSEAANSDYVWALRDINFEVKQGEILGIIGKNGAGKSTLLKILSRVTSPTTGSIKTKGRIASLLEVGTGMHPELTGMENIYLNGAILGMTKGEIRAKIDEIVDFSGCQMYIDTPVKRYSSGMRVRLGFAVAAFLEPDILVVDEVLAVGDAEFQKKAIGKMQDISNTNGRTVLFVSHNMVSIQDLCTRVVVLESGAVAYNGGTAKGIENYLEGGMEVSSSVIFDKKNHFKMALKSFEIREDGGGLKSVFKSGENIEFHTEIETFQEIRNPVFSLRLINQNNVNVVTWRSNDYLESPFPSQIKNKVNIAIKTQDLFLMEGRYRLSMSCLDGKELLDYQGEFIAFDIIPSKPNEAFYSIDRKKSTNSVIYSVAKWKIENM